MEASTGAYDTTVSVTVTVVTGWVVLTGNGRIFGPFTTANDAGKWLEENLISLSNESAIHPIIQPW